jgi:hypothetical protein
MRLIALTTAITLYSFGLGSQTPAFSQPTTPTAVADTSALQRAYQSFAAGEALERAGRLPEAADRFRSAAAQAKAGRDTHLAIAFLGRAIAATDSTLFGTVATQLGTSPLNVQTLDIEAEAAFVEQARQTLSPLQLVEAGDVTGMIMSAADAHAVLEDLASKGRSTNIQIQSPQRGLEVRIRRWVFQFQNGPWETIRADTTLSQRKRVRYEFCYINPASQRAELIDQPCTESDTCSITVPSTFATRVNNCGS